VLHAANGTAPPQYGPYITDLYAKPWCRIGAYLVGALTGYILHKTNNQLRMNKVGCFFVLFILFYQALVTVWFCDRVTATHSRCDCNVETLRSASSIKRAVCHVCYDLKKKSVFKKPLALKTCNSLIMSENRS